MIKIKNMTILKLMMAIAMFSMPIALSTFIISSGQSSTASGEPTYAESGLTKFVKNNNDGGKPSIQHIYPDATNSNIQYKNITSDVSFDEKTKTISLGNIDGATLEMTDNYYFEHEDIPSSSSVFSVTANQPYHHVKIDESKYQYNRINGSENDLRQYTIKLISDVHLTNNSSIVMSSILGGYNTSGIGAAGPVNIGKYVNIDLNGHILTIDSDCTLYNYGHIYDSSFDENGKHKGMIDCKGTILTPFIVDDFDGGARQFAGTALALTTPFRIYSIPYLSCKVKFSSSSTLRALSSLNASSELRAANMIFIGSGGFLELQDANSFLFKDSYNPFFNDVRLSTQKDFAENYKSFYDLYGNIKLNSIKMTINVGTDVNVDMAEFAFPIPPYVHINITRGCSIDVPLMIDFYPGSSLYAEEGSTINFTSIKYKSVIGLISHDKKTSYGGIRVLNQLYPSTKNSLINSHANYNVTNYLKYEREEYDLYNLPYINGEINTKSRVEINSLIKQTNGNHTISGKINLGKNAIDSLNNLNGSFKFFSVDLFRYFYMEGGAKELLDYISNGAINQATVGSYLCLPLVSNGKVMFDVDTMDTNKYSSLYESGYVYDFSDGVYYNSLSNVYKGFMFSNQKRNDLEGSIVQFSSYSKDEHVVNYNNVDYKFFRNCFVPSDSFTDSLFDENNKKININNNTIDREIMINGSKSTTYKNYKQTRTQKWKKTWGSWKIEEDFKSRDKIAIEQLPDTTSQEKGTFKAVFACSISDVKVNDKHFNNINSLVENKVLEKSHTQKFTGKDGSIVSEQIGTASIYCEYEGKNNETFIYPNGATEYQSSYVEGEIIKGQESGGAVPRRIDTQERTWYIESATASYQNGKYSSQIKLFYKTKEGSLLLKYDGNLGTYVK